MDDFGDERMVWGIGLLGLFGLCCYMAFRPWPIDPASTATPQGPLSPVVYVAEILSGKPPAASNPPDRAKDIQTIEGGLLAMLGVWTFTKLASGLGQLFGPGVAANEAESGEGEEGESGEGEGVGGSILGDIATDIGEVL
jgi:hypothetical protein